jgi:hypothetical protein
MEAHKQLRILQEDVRLTRVITPNNETAFAFKPC